MFKTKAQQVRIVTEAFAGPGIVGRPGEVWVIDPGIPTPQALQQNSQPHDGPIPYGAVRFDEAGLKAYTRDNAPRSEPQGTEWWDEAAVKKNQGWSDSQLAAARASGFPKSNGRRDHFDWDGAPADSDPLWTSDSVKNWAANLRTLTVSGR